LPNHPPRTRQALEGEIAARAAERATAAQVKAVRNRLKALDKALAAGGGRQHRGRRPRIAALDRRRHTTPR
jgi:DNA-binding GntR family transcriptional regulator